MSDAYHLNDRILLLTHAPFGIDEMFLMKIYNILYEQPLLTIIKKYSRNIIMCLTGHRHQDTFRIYRSSDTIMGILGHPSISPLDLFAEPSIRHYTYNRESLVLYDYNQYILNLIETERTNMDRCILSYRFSSWYDQPKEITSGNLAKLIERVANDPFYLRRFLLTQHYRENFTLTSEKIIQTLCALTLFNFDGFLRCTKSLRSEQYRYPPMIMNYSFESNVLIDEQLIEQRTTNRSVIIVVILLWIIYIVVCKYFLRMSRQSIRI